MELQEEELEPADSSTLLPNEILDKIFRFLDTKSLLVAAEVCAQWEAVSVLSMNRRITLDTPYGHDSYQLKLRLYCDTWFSLRVSEPKAREPKSAYYEGDIGVLASRTTCRTPLDGLLYKAFLFLPKFDWAQKVTHLILNQTSLSGRDVNAIAPILLSELRSLKCFHVFVDWSGHRLKQLDDHAAAERGALRAPPLNTSMEDLKLVYTVARDEERRKVFGNEFLDVQRFVAICPNLKKLKILCSVDSMDYKAGGEKLSSGNWDLKFSWKLPERHLVDICKDIKSIITGIPIENLKIQGKKQLAVVEAMVQGTCTLRKMALKSLFRDGCEVSIPEVIQRWNSNSAFRNLTDVSLGIPDSEVGLCEDAASQTGDFENGNLTNVTKLQLIQHENHYGDPNLRPNMTKFTEGYWISLLQFMPNVELLVTNWPISAFKFQAKMLRRLRHVVRTYTPIGASDGKVFESQELGEVLDSLKELQSYTLDVPWNRPNCNSEDAMSEFIRDVETGISLVRRSTVKLLQLNTSKLPQEVLDELSNNAESEKLTIRLFDIMHRHFFRYVRGVSLESCEMAVQTGENCMAPNMKPCETLHF